MDIYQIIITHNRAWTIREVICFSVVFCLALILALRLLRKKKINVPQAVSGLLLLTFLAVVFGSTVFTRNPGSEPKYELELFWSWKKVIYEGSRSLLKENLLNMILLFPMGILLPVVRWRRLSWRQGFLSGAAVSAAIELCQLLLCRGLFEWDDMIHNGIGCMAGCMLSGIAVQFIQKKHCDVSVPNLKERQKP